MRAHAPYRMLVKIKTPPAATPTPEPSLYTLTVTQTYLTHTVPQRVPQLR